MLVGAAAFLWSAYPQSQPSCELGSLYVLTQSNLYTVLSLTPASRCCSLAQTWPIRVLINTVDWTILGCPSFGLHAHQRKLCPNREVPQVFLSDQLPVADLACTNGCLAQPDMGHLQCQHSLVGTVTLPSFHTKSWLSPAGLAFQTSTARQIIYSLGCF